MWMRGKDKLHALELFRQGRGFKRSETILLTQDIGAELKVTVSHFALEESDSTGYIWQDLDGNRQVMEMPPYYISEECEALLNLDDYCRHALPLYIKSLLKDANPIIRQTFEMATQYIICSKVNITLECSPQWC
jgi:hypothetical protein